MFDVGCGGGGLMETRKHPKYTKERWTAGLRHHGPRTTDYLQTNCDSTRAIRTTISQNLRTSRKFFLLVLVLVFDWVSRRDYEDEDEDEDEDDSVAAAPLRVSPGSDHRPPMRRARNSLPGV